MGTWSDVRAGLAALSAQWLLLMGGGVLAVLLQLLERLWRPVSKRWYVLILVAFTFVAGFEAWRNERYQRDSVTKERDKAMDRIKELSSPDLQGEIYQVSVGGPAAGDQIFAAIASIRNLGAATAITCCRMTLTPVGASTPKSLVEITVLKDATFDIGNKRYVFQATDLLANQLRDGLDRNRQRHGYVLFRIPGLPLSEAIRHGTRYDLFFRDVHGKESSATMTWDVNALSRGGPAFWAPGLNPSFQVPSIEPPPLAPAIKSQ